MDLLGIVGKATKAFFDVRTISVDNWTFKLYYKVSVVLVVFCSVIVTSRQFFGSPINCDPGEVRMRSNNQINLHLANINCNCNRICDKILDL